jgi:dihydroorotase
VKQASTSSHPSSSSIAHQPLALINARLIDPAALDEKAGGVLIVDGLIRDFGAVVMPANLPAHARIIECGGDCVAPGLIDMWAFIGEPGAEHRETIPRRPRRRRAASTIARPDTNPPVTCGGGRFSLRRARDTGACGCFPWQP